MLYIDQIQVDWTPSLVLKKKNSLKHAPKIHGGQSELPEQRYLNMTVLMMFLLMHLYINQSTKQVICFSKNQSVIKN